MIEHEYTFRVMYPDTDQMGSVHLANYVKYYETARWELFRNIGISYHSVEEAGYMLPVIDMKFKFLKTTHYDAKLRVKTTLTAVKGVRIWFSYELYNEKKRTNKHRRSKPGFCQKGRLETLRCTGLCSGSYRETSEYLGCK